MIFAHWHGDELVLASQIRHYRVATMTSTSKDGQIMDTVVKLIGGKTSRGSATRGGVGALKGLLKLLKSGFNASMAVDGPKGPIYKVKPGVFEIARVVEAPIYCSGISVDRFILFKKTWNQTYLPKPFAKILLQWSEPIYISRTEDPRNPQLALDLETRLHAAKYSATKLIAEPRR